LSRRRGSSSDLYDDTVVALDREGKELPSTDKAREEAMKQGPEMARAEVLEGHPGLGHRIEVTDAHDGPVATMRFKDAVKLHPWLENRARSRPKGSRDRPACATGGKLAPIG
jgi:hypothetical protein